MAWCWGTFFIQAGLAVGNSGWVAFGEWLGADLEAAMGIAIIYIIIFGIMNLLSMRMYKWLINILFIVPFLGSLVTAGAAVSGMMGGPAAAKAAWDATCGNERVSSRRHNAMGRDTDYANSCFVGDERYAHIHDDPDPNDFRLVL